MFSALNKTNCKTYGKNGKNRLKKRKNNDKKYFAFFAR